MTKEIIGHFSDGSNKYRLLPSEGYAYITDEEIYVKELTLSKTMTEEGWRDATQEEYDEKNPTSFDEE